MAKKETMLEKIQKLSSNPKNIRNIGIVAHIDHGKTTLTDNLLARAGMISEDLAGTQLFMDYDAQEQERGITIYSANVSMVHELKGEHYLINLIDTPGHVDFGGDVTRAMRAVDGALVVVDAVEGVMPQTETVLRQALKERVKPVLFINKSDRLIKELKLDPQEMQNRFVKVIADVNLLIKRLAPELADKWKVSVENGSVAFGSALYNWAISIPFMKDTGIDFKKIIDMVNAGEQKKLAKEAPLHEVVLRMVAEHLINPVDAQSYRIPVIWKGDPDSEIAKDMLKCNAAGKLVGVVTNVEFDPHAGTICTARLFSGTLKAGDELKGLSSNTTQRIQQVGVYAGPRKLKIERVPAGNITALTGVDFGTGETIVEADLAITPFERIEHMFEPVVTKSIEPKRTGDLPKLIKVLRNRAKEDNTIKIKIDEETGETLVSGLGELHIEAKIERYLKDRNIDINVSKPIVVYRESVGTKSPRIEGKSPNKHNKLYITVEPLKKETYNALVEGKIPPGKIRAQDKERVRDVLVSTGMDKEEASRVKDVWGHNLYIDMSRGVQYLHEIQELIIQAFHSIVDEGPLAKEPCTGIVMKLFDAKLHEDAIHRGPAQIIPAVRDAMRQAIYHGKAQLLEPKQIIRIDAPSEVMGGAIKEVSNRRGQILDMKEENEASVIKAKIPVAEMFGFEAALKSATGGKGFYSLVDQVFEPLPENLRDQVILEIRKRKGMKEELPRLQ